MAKGRLILAGCMAVMLVMLPVATAWSVDPSAKNTSNGGMHIDGAGDSGHPWDDGTNQPPPDSTKQRLTAVALPPVVGPVMVPGGTKWITGGVLYLLQKANVIGSLNKARFAKRK